jgi:hypothetical protein
MEVCRQQPIDVEQLHRLAAEPQNPAEVGGGV